MREIKFRVWDKFEKIMYKIENVSWHCLGKINNISVYENDSLCKSYVKNHNVERHDIKALELMQYTGLKNKNGKEIYEGDILRVENTDLAVIIYDEDRMAWGIRPINEFYFDSPLLADNTSLEVKVIGNIYENPELLEKGE